MSTLSFCIVAHNEDEVFEKSLSSIKNVADEIIIVFEPTTNKKTVNIGKKYTKKIFYDKLQDWSTSFNYANKLATGDYLINWDADFVLRDSSEQKLLELKNKNFDSLDSLVLHWNIEFTDDYQAPLVWVKRKLIHKKGLYTFSHPLHPRHVFLPERNEKLGYYPNIEVDHYNTYAGRKPRYERFLKIMGELVSANPDDPESLFYYGEELIFAKDFTKAYEVWNTYLGLYEKDPLNRLLYGITHFCHVCIELGKYAEALEMINKFSSFYHRKSATFDLMKSDVLLVNNDIENAINGYNYFIDRYSTTNDLSSFDISDYYRLKVYPYYILAKIYKLTGNPKQSEIFRQKALENAISTQQKDKIMAL